MGKKEHGIVVVGVDLKSGTVVVQTDRGNIVERKAEKSIVYEQLPEGAIRALLPEFQRAFMPFQQLIGTDNNFWLTIEETAPYSKEKAVNLLRRYGHSTDEVAKAAVNEMLILSGKQGMVDKSVMEELADIFEDRVSDLYAETTEVKPKKTRAKTPFLPR